MKKHISIVKKPNKLSSFFLKEKWVFLAIVIFGVLYNVGMLVNPTFQGKLVDSISSLNSENSISSILQVSLLYVLMIILVQSCRALKRFYVRKLAYKVQNEMRLIIFNNILNEDLNHLKNEKIGTLISRAISDVNNAVEGMRKVTTEIFDTALLFIVYIIYLFLFSPIVTLYALIPVICSIALAFILRNAVYKYSSLSRESNSKLSNMSYDLFDNALLYRVNGRDDYNLKEYDNLLDEYEKNNRKAQIIKDVMIPLVNMISLIGLIPILYFFIPYVIEGKELYHHIIGITNQYWTIGLFSTYLSTFVLMSSKASHTAKLFSSISSGLACWQRIKPYIKEYSEYKEGEISFENNEIVFTNFSISLNNVKIINNISCVIKKGEIIGITGPVACGKTLLGKTLIKEYDYEGSLTYFGKELKDIDKNSINKYVSYMGHNSELFTDTIENNIAFGESKNVNEYLSFASFDEDMKNMPLKEKTLVGNEGVKLSGGQQQRIALARTFYHEKPIYILDDPFSSVDIKTEYEIISKIKKINNDSIIFLISHRLSVFKDLDNIFVFDGNGKIQIGKHEELLKSSKIYNDIYTIQKNTQEVKND